jgi:ketosteroid isomerase-like protein
MSDFQAIADRVEIEALRGEFTDAAMMCDYDRVASLFTPDGALRMPNVPVELVGREQREIPRHHPADRLTAPGGMRRSP